MRSLVSEPTLAPAREARATAIDPIAAVTLPLKESSSRMREAAAAMSGSAVRAGVAEDEPLGRLLRSFEDMVLAFSEAGAGTAERVAATLENTRGLAISEVHRLKEANALAHRTIESLKVAETVVRLRTDEAVSGIIKSVTPDLIKALNTVTVIREQRWNRRQNWTRVFATACVLLGIFGVGYLSGGGDFRGRDEGELAKVAVQRCREAAKPDRITGATWCPVSVLEAPRG